MGCTVGRTPLTNPVVNRSCNYVKSRDCDNSKKEHGSFTTQGSSQCDNTSGEGSLSEVPACDRSSEKEKIAGMSHESDDDILFDFDNPEDFKRERDKLNYDNTLKIWYNLPSELPTNANSRVKLYTPKEQQSLLKRIKSFIVRYEKSKGKNDNATLRAEGIRMWNDILNVSCPVESSVLYEIYQGLSRYTNEFLKRAKLYDPTIDDNRLFKAQRTVEFMAVFQAQTNPSFTLTDSALGYTMLYPYTDDFIDCNEVSQEAKQDFAEIFYKRLLIGESNYDPEFRFDGQQSNISELELPPSLHPYSDCIGKIFDMVKFIENDWSRSQHKGVYMSLATIHESQMKSILQHAQSNNNYVPTMEKIEEISADKGAASLSAVGFLTEGRLSRLNMAYLEYMGFGLQLLDDLQDVTEDMKENHRTIFTQLLFDGHTLDAPTARLVQYFCYAPNFEEYFNNHHAVSSTQGCNTFAPYVRTTLVVFSVLLILESVSRLRPHYSEKFYREISAFSPLPMEYLKDACIEKTFWTAVQNQQF